MSSRFAFSYAIALYFVILALLLASVYYSEQPARPEELTTNFETLLIWKSIHEHLLYANGIASGLVALVTPVFYFVRRTGLHIDEGAQLRLLKEFARTDPDGLMSRRQDSNPGESPPQEPTSEEAPPDGSWFSILEVSPFATVDEIKEAYKVKIKQNHPDRVHGMAPMFRDLAEDETKKLNAAYEESLMSHRLS